MTHISRILLLTSVMLASLLTFTVQARETKSERLLRREIGYLVKRSDSPRTLKAMEVYSRRQHRVLYSSDDGLLLHPASNLKIITTSFAFDRLGIRYVFSTPIEFDGTRKADTLAGDIVIVGMGDPIISYNELDSAAQAIHLTGINYITGSVIIDISRFDSLQWGAGWMWDDEPESFAMFISPATFNHDAISVTVGTDSTGKTLVVTTEPATSFVKVVSDAKPGTADSITVNRVMANGANVVVVSGTYTPELSPQEFDFSVRHPDQYFGHVFKELLTKAGIHVGGNVSVTRALPAGTSDSVLFSINHTIDSVVTYTNKNSDNLGAECLLRSVPLAAGKAGSADTAIVMEKNFLADQGVDSTEYYIVDGSGVSHYNLITPAAIVSVLCNNLDRPYGASFIHSLPVAGVDGSLDDRMKADYVRGKVLAKTGSISGVSTLSGYVVVPHDTLVFSMMMQNFIGRSDSMRALQDSICSVLAQYSPYSRTFATNLRRHHIGTYSAIPTRKHQLVKPKKARAAPGKAQTKRTN